jgi:hypothetical protein
VTAALPILRIERSQRTLHVEVVGLAQAVERGQRKVEPAHRVEEREVDLPGDGGRRFEERELPRERGARFGQDRA